MLSEILFCLFVLYIQTIGLTIYRSILTLMQANTKPTTTITTTAHIPLLLHIQNTHSVTISILYIYNLKRFGVLCGSRSQGIFVHKIASLSRAWNICMSRWRCITYAMRCSSKLHKNVQIIQKCQATHTATITHEK